MEKEIISNKLDGPFTWHVYIGGGLSDSPRLFDLCNQLQKLKVSCFLKYNPEHQSLAIMSNITQGINRSQKCIIYLSSEYLTDDYFQIETEKILTKANRFSKDMVILLVDEKINIPEKLNGLNTVSFVETNLKDRNFINLLAKEILKEPSAKLTVLPKENVGYGSAFGYFYGFLRLVLPNFRKRLIENALGNDPGMKLTAVTKMLIIMPESCFCTVQMETPDKIIHTDRFVVLVANRAGNKQRDYKSSLYRLHDQELNKDYYFVGELATPLLTMYEMYHFNLAGMTKDQLYMERDAFYFALKAILSHPDNKECNDQFRLLYWCDPETESPNKVELYDFLLPVVREEVELAKEHLQIQEKVGSDLEQDCPPLSITTFEPVTVTGSHPGAIYESLLLDHYKLDKVVRGKCVIINIANFDKGNVYLSPRRGSEVDAANLKELFKQLRFEVEIHNDVTRDTLEKIMLTMHLIDHSRYDAFVCCILTHGKLGVVYTSDGQPIPILEITDFFSDQNCPSLKGKPKMFFIQACQKGSPQDPQRSGQSNSSASSTHQSNSSASSTHQSDSIAGDAAGETKQKKENEMSEDNIAHVTSETSNEPNKKDENKIVELRESSKKDDNAKVISEASSEAAVTPLEVDAEPVYPEGYNYEDDLDVNLVDVGVIEIQYEPGSELESAGSGEAGVQPLDTDAAKAPSLKPMESLPTSFEHRSSLVPGCPDFLMSYSTLPGSISYRDTLAGSLYIQALVEYLKSGHEIDRALKMVSTRVKMLLRQRQDNVTARFQLPFHLTSGMDKLIYL